MLCWARLIQTIDKQPEKKPNTVRWWQRLHVHCSKFDRNRSTLGKNLSVWWNAQVETAITFFASWLGWQMFISRLLDQTGIVTHSILHVNEHAFFTVPLWLPKLVSSQSPHPSSSPPAPSGSCMVNNVAGTGGGGVRSLCRSLSFVALLVKCVPSSKKSGVGLRGWSFIGLAVCRVMGVAGVLPKSSHASSSPHPSTSFDDGSWPRVDGGTTGSSKSC